MDSNTQDDSGVGRRMGLARLAKTHSLSSSLNNLQRMEGKPDEKDDISSPHVTHRVHDQSSELHASPLRSLNKQSAAVSLLPNKMNLSELSGQQPIDRKGRGTSLEEDWLSLDSGGHYQIICSDPDFIKNAKPAGRTNHSHPMVNQRGSSDGSEQEDTKAAYKDSQKIKTESSYSISHKLSRQLSRRSHLAPPQVKRSNSMTRLTEAVNQIHNICVFPARQLAKAESEGLAECSSKSPLKSPSIHLPESEVNISAPLTPLIATNTRTDVVRTQSPKLARQPAFREIIKENKKSCMDSLNMCASHGDRVSNSRSDLDCGIHSSNVSCPKYCPFSQLNANVLENGFCASYPPRTKLQISSGSNKALSLHSESLDVGSSRSSENKHVALESKDEKRVRGEISQRSTNIPKSSSGSGGLKHASTSPDNFINEDDLPCYDASCLQSNLGHNMPESPLQACRSASLDELNNIGASYGLPVISPIDAKKKNYLFGGLSSLLGASELDRYFPARTINIFIATWNMNGKEPPVNLEAFLLPEEMDHLPDMFVVGTQESGGSRSEWEVRLQATIGPSHVLFTSAVFGVLHLTIFIRRDLLWFCSVPEEDTYSLRPGIAYKTKGGMAIGFQFFGTRILFINSHLTAHEEKQSLRIQNFRNITHSLDLPRLLPHKHKHKDVTHRYDCVFWLGDLNFRLAVSRDHVFERLKHPGLETYKHLLQWDQLSQAQKKGEAFGEFEEGPINFAPTFKYDPGTDHYDTSSKQRVPSYTDRILFKSNRGAITCVNYSSCPLFRTSDHKPVLGAFHCKIRPGKDDVPLAAGLFNRDVYLEALRRRRQFLYQPTLRNCPVQ